MDKENAPKETILKRKGNGETQKADDCDGDSCNQQRWKQQRHAEEENDEEHHIPDPLERQIEQWMDDSNYTLMRKPNPDGTNNENITNTRRKRRQNELNRKDDTQNHQNNTEKNTYP